MYPRNYFELFPPFPRQDKIFVAMSFDKRFQNRWKDVIAPAISSITFNDVQLEPHRVDVRRIGDSILTEILGGISNDRLIFADLTTLGHLGGIPIRSGNVMYEVGLAHARRLPEEILLFRSDHDNLLFDVANVRVNDYDPDSDPVAARSRVADAIREALHELKLQKHLAVKFAAESLDFTALSVLANAIRNPGIPFALGDTPGQMLEYAYKNAAIVRLLQIGAITKEFEDFSRSMLADPLINAVHLLNYTVTPFGKCILEYVNRHMSSLQQVGNKSPLEDH
jgi:hypothetical protein